MSSHLGEIVLKPERDFSVRRFHPWIFSGAISKKRGDISEGDIVRVVSHSGEYLGTGHFSDASIAVKIFTFEDVLPDQSFWEQAILNAYELRRMLGLTSGSTTNAYRLVNAEGDNLPGLIIDIYKECAVLQFHSIGMYRIKSNLIEALKKLLGEKIKAIFNKSAETLSQREKEVVNGYEWGETSERQIVENGLKFTVNWESGQKTGFFLDQRENRKLIASLATGRNVLNCFSYTGAFSVYALQGGASAVTSIDSSADALTLAAQNISNNFPAASHSEVAADCLHYLRELNGSYGLIVLDPPAFVKHKGALRGGMVGYETINFHALRQIERSGILATFSCSQMVDRALFKDTVVKAAQRAGRKVQILYELRQAPCHPVSIYHPEGEYLKGLILRVE